MLRPSRNRRNRLKLSVPLQRERQRQQNKALAAKRAAEEAVGERVRAEAAGKLGRPEGRQGGTEEEDDDEDEEEELAREASLMKKLRRGKISESEFRRQVIPFPTPPPAPRC